MAYMPLGPKDKAFAVPTIPATDSYGDNPFPSAPTMTLYSPATTAYVKVTPAADTLLMTVAPTVTTETLTYASVITHKIADVTAIAATNPATNDTTELYALADEVIDDLIVHIASTAYHVTATGTITHTAATTEATAVAEVNLIRTNLLSHLASATVHGGRADAVNLALVAATSACTNKATAVTLINLLATYYLAHLAIVDDSIAMTTGAAVMPMRWPCVGPFWCKTNVSAHTFSTCEFKST
jgi:hypothetical protein